jgi:hypothetical protein
MAEPDIKMASSSDGLLVVHTDTTATPGLLRLPPEIRHQIYELLAADKSKASRYNLSLYPSDDRIWRRTQLFKFPIAHVCQRLRYEAISFFYSRF